MTAELTIIISLLLASPPVRAADDLTKTPAKIPSTTSKDASGNSKRNFYEVLEDVLADFEYDLKNNEVSGLRDLSIRNIAISENVPASFKEHVELLVSERILKMTKTRIVRCLQCRAQRASLTNDNVVITSPENNPAELARIAKMQGIANFMDVAFSFQPSGMLLSIYITDSETGSIVWSRSYNSETSRAAAFRRGVDFSQIDDGRQSAEYKPKIMFKPIIYYLFEPTPTDYIGVIGIGFRMVERYDNRKKEVGFEINYLLDTNLLVGSAATPPTDVYSGFNLTLLFIHAWNLIGNLENYNSIRWNIFAGIGGTYTVGLLGGLARGGVEWRLGKHWGFSANIGYRPPATRFISGISSGEIHGVEFGIGVGAMF